MSLKEIIQKKEATVIDVRNADELAEGKFPGSLHIPVHEIPGRIAEISSMKAPLVLYCRSGNRSNMAIMMLKTAGLRHEMYNGGGLRDMQDLLN